MSAASLAKAMYLCRFCHPKSDRPLYRAVRRIRPRRIVQLGFGDGMRAERLISLARTYRPDEVIHYAAIDMFEAGCTATSVPLKVAHRRLSQSGAKARLIPGDPATALAGCANSLKDVDLLVIDALGDPREFTNAWFYMPRMLHDGSIVAHYMVENAQSTPKLRFMSCSDVYLQAQAAGDRRRAA